MTTNGVYWLFVLGYVLGAAAWWISWWNFARIVASKDGTIDSLHAIVGMQRDTLARVVHDTWVQQGDQSGKRLIIEMDAATWAAIHETVALSSALLSQSPPSIKNKGAHPDGP